MPNDFSQRPFALGLGLSLALGSGAIANAAEPLQLTCESSRADESSPGNYRAPVKFRIDLDNRIVDLLQPGGFVMASTTDRKMNALAPSVRITGAAIAWKLPNSVGPIFEGSIDRETGNATASWFGPRGTYANAPIVAFHFQGRCQRATQKF
jgi:hypothetical protein